MTLLIFYLFLAIVVSFFCSVSEAVLLSVRPSYISMMERKKKRGAHRLRKLYDNLDKPLAAILTANTIAHTVGAAGVGAQAAIVFGNEYLGITSGVLTFLILVFSEIIPKTLGATYWQALAPTFGYLIHGLTVMLYPFVWMSQRLTRLLAPKDYDNVTYSRDEMQAMVEIGAKEGLLDDNESKIAGNLMRLYKLPIRSFMTPRSVIFSVSENETVEKFFKDHADQPFSRIPVYGEGADDVKGYVLKTDLLIAQARDEFKRKLKEFQREFVVVPDTLMASDIYNRLIKEKSHIALVVDEFGTTQGLVTLEDVFETIIGLEIVDESDHVEDMQDLAHQNWRKKMRRLGISPKSLKGKK